MVETDQPEKQIEVKKPMMYICGGNYYHSFHNLTLYSIATRFYHVFV